MYEWLERELDAIRTRRFHVIRAEVPATWSSRAIDWPTAAPPSFAEFTRRFGAVQLYRESDFYLVQVWPKPVAESARAGSEGRDVGGGYLVFGGYAGGAAGFRSDEIARLVEPPVWEIIGAAGFRRSADSFEEWIERRGATARTWFSTREWASILRGPAPFSDEERAIVDARRRFAWRLLDVSSDGALRVEVTNQSDRVLPYLSIGIRAPGFIGGVWLQVSHIGPGETAVVEHEGYGHLADPRRIEAFSYPDPEPEDRRRYWEFGGPVT